MYSTYLLHFIFMDLRVLFLSQCWDFFSAAPRLICKKDRYSKSYEKRCSLVLFSLYQGKTDHTITGRALKKRESSENPRAKYFCLIPTAPEKIHTCVQTSFYASCIGCCDLLFPFSYFSCTAEAGKRGRAKLPWQGDALTPLSTALGWRGQPRRPACPSLGLGSGHGGADHQRYPLRAVPREILAPVSPAHPSRLSVRFPAKVTHYGRQFSLHANNEGAHKEAFSLLPPVSRLQELMETFVQPGITSTHIGQHKRPIHGAPE